MPKISKEQIQEIKRRPSAESVVPDLPSECAGSYQELGYYRHGVKRAECLMPYWDKINYLELLQIVENGGCITPVFRISIAC